MRLSFLAVKKLCFLTEYLLWQGYPGRFDAANLPARCQNRRACRRF